MIVQCACLISQNIRRRPISPCQRLGPSGCIDKQLGCIAGGVGQSTIAIAHGCDIGSHLFGVCAFCGRTHNQAVCRTVHDILSKKRAFAHFLIPDRTRDVQTRSIRGDDREPAFEKHSAGDGNGLARLGLAGDLHQQSLPRRDPLDPRSQPCPSGRRTSARPALSSGAQRCRDKSHRAGRGAIGASISTSSSCPSTIRAAACDPQSRPNAIDAALHRITPAARNIVAVSARASQRRR